MTKTATAPAAAIDEVAGWLAVYRAAAAERKRAEEVMAQAREKIEDALGDNEVGTVAGAPAVRWTYVHSETFDQKKARALLNEDDLAACLVTRTTRRFSLVDAEDTP